MKQIDVPLHKLLLDPENPRLPRYILDHGDSELILSHIRETGSLEELAHSFVDNGFFEAERLIVIKHGKDSYIVVEGNRRLATLILLHRSPDEHSFTGIEPTKDQLSKLTEIPCILVDSRSEINKYLAYRHIGGMKTWSAEARARFIRRMVDNEAATESTEPFKRVGRQVGSNAQGIRNSYLAISLLEHASEEFGIDTSRLQYDRFGVWIRCMNSSDIRDYIRLGRPTTYQEVRDGVRHVDEEHLREICSDLSPSQSRARPLVADSRDITDYGSILASDRARKALRKHANFEIARQLIRQGELPQRLSSLSSTLELIIDDVSGKDVIQDNGTVVADSERIASLAKSLKALIAAKVSNDED